jgi:predicted ATPase
VAHDQVDRFADGVFFVGLADEREPDDAFGAIALALEATTVGTSPLDRVSDALGERQMLLVLDNVEQVKAIGVGLVELLERCPRVTFMVTSREALRVSAEHVFAVPVLSLPVDNATDVRLEDVQRSEAGRLFIERARAVGAGFVPTDEDAADIASICRRLDGLPLAIELAAARVKLYSVGELRVALDRRLDLLSGGGHDLPSRQRTLRDAIEWSDQLLSDDERLVFRLMSVFSGARLRDIDETLRDVTPARGIDVVETIGSLVDKNLLRVTSGADRRPRFSMLETIRSYTTEQLAEVPDVLGDVRRAHAAHYSAVALDLQRQLSDADRRAVLTALGDELGNLNAAWQTYRERRDVAAMDDLLAPLWGYYEARGDYRAALGLGEDLLDSLSRLPDTPDRRHHEFTLHANLARTQLVVHGFSAEAERAVVDALRQFEASADARQRFPALRSLAALQLWRSDFANAGDSARELMAIAESERDPALLLEARLMSCISTNWVCDLGAAVADADMAARYFEATSSGFVGFRVGPNPGVVANAAAGLLKWTAGSPHAAVASMQRALDLAVDLDHPYSHAFALHHVTLLDYWRHDTAAVRARAEESQHVAAAHGYAVWAALALVFHGIAAVADGDCDRGIDEMEQGFERYEGLATPPIFWPALLAIRAATHATAGNHDRALVLIDEAWRDLGDHPVTAELELAHGDILLAAPDPDHRAAARHFERAAEHSAGRGARMLELQSLTRLATQPVDTPTDSTVRSRLRAVYDTFSEGFDTPQLRAAAAVLAERVPESGRT